GHQDTSEIYYYKYSKTNNLIEESRYIHKEFNYKVIYEYNDQNQIIKKIYYDNNPDKIAAIDIYAYDKKGNEIEEVSFDLRKSKTKPDYKYKTIYEYWK